MIRNRGLGFLTCFFDTRRYDNPDYVNRDYANLDLLIADCKLEKAQENQDLHLFSLEEIVNG